MPLNKETKLNQKIPFYFIWKIRFSYFLMESCFASGKFYFYVKPFSLITSTDVYCTLSRQIMNKKDSDEFLSKTLAGN